MRLYVLEEPDGACLRRSPKTNLCTPPGSGHTGARLCIHVRFNTADEFGKEASSAPAYCVSRSEDRVCPKKTARECYDSPVHILIVDDEKLLTWTMDRFLTRAGYQVTALNDPQLALEHCRHTSFDLLISDVLMPTMSGLELAAQVKDCQPDCRIILLSGQAGTNDLLKGTKAEFLPVEIARKPIQPEELLRLIGASDRPGN